MPLTMTDTHIEREQCRNSFVRSPWARYSMRTSRMHASEVSDRERRCVYVLSGNLKLAFKNRSEIRGL